MAEDSFIWAAGGGGDESPHTVAETAAIMAAIAGQGGVANAGILHGLAPSSIAGATQVRVAAGWAICDGHPYLNTANFDYTPVTPAVGTTGRLLVLRASWSAQTVRLVEKSSADGTGSIPSPTQTSGTTYEIPVASYTVTTGGAVGSFIDRRTFAIRTPLAELALRALSDSRYVAGYFVGGAAQTFGASGAVSAGLGFCVTAGSSNPTMSSAGASRSRLNTNAASQTITLSTNGAAVAPSRSPLLGVRATPKQTSANLAAWLMGFMSAFSATPNGAYFRRVTTGNVFAVTRQSTETTTDLGALSDSTLREWRVYSLDAGVTWVFEINGAVVAVHTSDVPTAATNLASGSAVVSNGSGDAGGNFDIEQQLLIADKAA